MRPDDIIEVCDCSQSMTAVNGQLERVAGKPLMSRSLRVLAVGGSYPTYPSVIPKSTDTQNNVMAVDVNTPHFIVFTRETHCHVVTPATPEAAPKPLLTKCSACGCYSASHVESIPAWTNEWWRSLHLSIPATDNVLDVIRRVPGVDEALRFHRYEVRFRVGQVFELLTVCSAVQEAVGSLAQRSD